MTDQGHLMDAFLGVMSLRSIAWYTNSCNIVKKFVVLEKCTNNPYKASQTFKEDIANLTSIHFHTHTSTRTH